MRLRISLFFVCILPLPCAVYLQEPGFQVFLQELCLLQSSQSLRPSQVQESISLRCCMQDPRIGGRENVIDKLGTVFLVVRAKLKFASGVGVCLGSVSCCCCCSSRSCSCVPLPRWFPVFLSEKRCFFIFSILSFFHGCMILVDFIFQCVPLCLLPHAVELQPWLRASSSQPPCQPCGWSCGHADSEEKGKLCDGMEGHQVRH